MCGLDGVMICICRHPADWCSAARHEIKYAEANEALAQWRESVESLLALKRSHPEQVFLVSFAALINGPHAAMCQISQRLGLTWHPILTTPTFNGMPISSNSSFNSVAGIDPTTVRRREHAPAEIRGHSSGLAPARIGTSAAGLGTPIGQATAG